MLKEEINKYYSENRRNRDQKHFYISDAGKCPRRVFYSFNKVPKKEIAPNFLRLFDHGDHMHQMIMKTLSMIKGIRIVAFEADIPRQETVSGRIDVIIEFKGELYIIDVKSMNSMIFMKMKEAKEDNVKQLQLYLHYFKIKNGILLYVNKDNLMIKEYAVYENPKEVKKMLDGLEDLREQIDAGLLPPRIPDYPKDWKCRYCDYRKTCRED